MTDLDTSRLEPAALAELQSLSPAVLRGLPLPTRLTVRLPGAVDVQLCVAGDPSDASIASFAPAEVEALACAIEHGRADAADVIGWVARKRQEPEFRLDLPTALQGAVAPTAPGWSLGRLLREIGATIIDGSLWSPAVSAMPRAA